MENTRQRIINLLEKAKAEYISGQQISNVLEISRTAVWKHMKELEKDGYVIEAIAKKGYKIIESPDKLSVNTIQWGLHTDWLGKQVIHKPVTPSTQTLAQKLAIDGAEHGTVVIADEQTAGKGRLNRAWHSPNQGIWMSLLLRPVVLPYQASQLTLLTATVLVKVIEEITSVRPAIKWPNDIFIGDRKVAGILTEMQSEHDQIQYLIIGIGINVNQKGTDFPEELREKATSIRTETDKEWDMRVIIQHILQDFEKKYEHYIKEGFATIRSIWEDYGYKIGHEVTVKTMQEEQRVKIVGLQEDGSLLVENNGKRTPLYSGEIIW
ncbi:biotin--[acetyl-CoA-carboxylase] ligase [Radiobacillus kanasensis]|uniref:biotin--[acetyl-CoA-carboxylase] ligase n=1 Tax=Radiobacillus kanasensis TaxID=2844358 RepID=UPI001E3C9843|nr:biotin--[acetyl-CoA-carboxylase] ligase [Radiobacillus kanasensis]UFU01284.1 biotin--[acetyl-CoA-carboxylase] ligase [Radiobacillus kanasensis]